MTGKHELSQKALNQAHSDLDTAIRMLQGIAELAENAGYACCNDRNAPGRDSMGMTAGYLHESIGAAMKARAAAGSAELPGGVKPEFGGK